VFIHPPANLTALDGKDATITCQAEGAPAPNVTWYFNGMLNFTFMRRI
jgi:protein sidekick